MSLILEALRKSEAERRRGQVPGLHAELPPPHATRAAAFPAWAGWLLACTLLLAAAWLLRPMASPQPATATPAPGDAGAAVKAAPGFGAGVSPGASSDSAAPPRFRMPPATTVPTATPTPAHMPATDTPSPSATRPPAIAAPPTPPATATRGPPSPGPMPSTTTPMASPNAPLQLSDLSAEERKSLPPLKLSLHLWNPDPAKRFVIVDGNRVGEGGRVGDAVVAEITSDGVVLDWNGRRLQLPIR